MGLKERKERERDQRRELILMAATEIMASEGLENVSIRKIASKIEYSPAIIYHYFQDKDDIINHLMQRGYQKIMAALAAAQTSTDEPVQKLRNLLRTYVAVALQMSDEFKTVQLSNSPGVLEHTSSLFKGASTKKPALKILFGCLKEIYRDKSIDDGVLELTAQVIATSAFGLIIRLINEKDLISVEQQNNLIDHFIKVTVNGIALGKALSDY